MKASARIEEGISLVLSRWRASTRSRVVFQNILMTFLGRVVNVVSTLLSVPLAIRALGQEQYGLFAAILSITSFFAYADFGLAYALVTELTQAEARGDHLAARRAVTQVWFFLIGCAIVVAILGAAAVSFGLVDHFFPSAPRGSVKDAWIVLIAASALGIPLAISQRIFFALQMGATAQAWATTGRLGGLVGAFLAACFWPTIAAFVAAVTLLPNLIAGASVVYLFFRLRPDLRPSLAGPSTEKLHDRVLTGLNFTILHLLNFAEVGVDTILIAQFFSPQTVAQFDLLTRLFGYVCAIIGLGLWPLWPAISSAVAQGDLKWIRTVRTKGLALVCVLSFGLAGLFLFSSNLLISLWTGVQLTLPDTTTLSISLVFFVTFSCIMSFMQMFMNAFNFISRQSAFALVVIIVIIPTKWILLKNGFLSGVILASTFTYFWRAVYFNTIVRRHIDEIDMDYTVKSI